MLVVDTGFSDALNHLRSVADGNGNTKGKLFERLVCSFLKTYPLYKDRFKNVWMWQDYPGRNGRGDSGVDLVGEENDGSLCAIQCKFYDSKSLTKRDIDSFLEFASRSEFDTMMLFYSGSGYGKRVEDALAGHGCMAVNFESLSGSNITWPNLAAGLTEVRQEAPLGLWKHQEDAIHDVVAGLKQHDRGQLLMACGTGKTLTSLRMAEQMVGLGGLILYAVPSISLMRQAIRYWSEQRTIQHTYVGVCSDPTVSHGEKTDIPIIEMDIGVSTDHNRISTSMVRKDDSMTVVFTTYQSMEAIVKAQEVAEEPFNLAFCDEAHRTTGVEQGSAFTLIHDNTKVRAKKRVYMTATPKIYKAVTKTRARDDTAIYSMDDGSSKSSDVFGPVLHRLSFSDAIDRDLLSDYEVIVLGVAEEYGAKVLQKIIATTTDEGDINLTDAARMLGLYRILERPDPDNEGARPLQTAITYTNRIRDSKLFADRFAKLILESGSGKKFGCDARHVDGTQNSTTKDGALQWLRDSTHNANECRVVSNARCLSEGVDVPSLDAIAFLNPKSSQVEIIQAVGRVMRKNNVKKRGYVIIPVGIPPNTKAEQILDSKKAFGTVWNVLRALRSHDSRMGVEADTAALKKQLPSKVRIINIDENGEYNANQKGAETFSLGDLDVPADALYSKIVDEVGDRLYFDRWARDVADVVSRIQERIGVVISDGPAKVKFDKYMVGLREIIHSGLTSAEGVEMLAQHVVTRRIFNAMFGSDDFTHSNPVSVVMDGVLEELHTYGLEAELRDLEKFYRSIEQRVAGLETHDARQPVISELYGTFFKKAFPKMADRLGIVYTPTEVVDFILRSVDYTLRENFGRGITDKGVNVIDPFTGAGTFMARLMSEDMGLIQDKDIKRKYTTEMFASEIVLLAYYIAAVNCESVFGQRTGVFQQFEGLSLTNTFNPGSMDEHTGDIMAGPKRRIRRQREADITVVIGNPPYSSGQKSANEDNPNTSHREIENRIRETYAAKIPHIKQKRSLYNTYIGAIRWASDRIGKSGVIGFIIPSSFITRDTMAGVRACLYEEFTDVYCFDLLGQKGIPGHGRNIFEYSGVSEGGTTVSTCIVILVKNPSKTDCSLHYASLSETEYKGEQKRSKVKELKDISHVPWGKPISPDKYHDWLNQSGDAGEEFRRYLPIGSDKGKKHKDSATNEVVFARFATGVGTGRDDWSYNSSANELTANMKRHTDYYNSVDLDNFPTNPTQAKKSDFAIERLKRLGRKLKFRRRDIRMSLHKPFFKQYFHYEPVFISRPKAISICFPSGDSENLVIIVPKGTDKGFSAYISNITPDLEVVHHGQCFPFYAYENGRKKQNITEYTLRLFQRTYSDNSIGRKDIFYYVYGLLHHPGYRKRYKNILTSSLPTIPLAPDFWAFSTAGKELAKLHLNYETGRRYRLGKPLNPIPDSPRKIRFGEKPNPESGRQDIPDHSVLVIDGNITYDNIPHMKYTVDGRTPIQWFVDRYAFSTNKESGITNYPLYGKSGEDVQVIIERLVWVGMESDRIISGLEKLEFKMDILEESDLQKTLV